MATLGDLARRGAITALAGMVGNEPQTMREFTRNSGLVSESAKQLRLDLEFVGLIQTKKIGTQGVVELVELALTPLGRQVAARLVEVDELLQRNRREKEAKRK